MSKEEWLMVMCYFIGASQGLAFTNLYHANKKVEELKQKYIKGYGSKKFRVPDGCGYQPISTGNEKTARPPRKK